MIILSAPERVAVAQAIGVNEQYLYQCLTRRRVTPPDRRPALERELYPRVKVEDFGDDVRWQRVPDPDWPHPDGRPCLDVAAPQRQAA